MELLLYLSLYGGVHPGGGGRGDNLGFHGDDRAGGSPVALQEEL